MKELSLHILDLVQNSIKAEATEVRIEIIEDLTADKMKILIIDNGQGISEEFLEDVLDPFTTTRTTRKVGLGLPLFQAAAEQCNGELNISSTEGKGTTVEATFQHSHIDRVPLGDIVGTIVTIIQGNPDLDLYYRHVIDNEEFSFVTSDLRDRLQGVPLNKPEVIKFIKEYLSENIEKIKKTEELK
ncbi:ATP-binding protein [Acetohalobium arabaticum]|uniref:histidine kinase n=1 Tax=Acetohalobium arabaticum (strain ATCC 49924 / DSM 5501 / Z-7288) TaxID=574087 RepID=D9QS24_ACEAZ|nr:ATP-binding protein [Acetohalobium arabaticum]ADL13315.1 histidine kinase [Acetohalobium arabaticum DSM 5501]